MATAGITINQGVPIAVALFDDIATYSLTPSKQIKHEPFLL